MGRDNRIPLDTPLQSLGCLSLLVLEENETTLHHLYLPHFSTHTAQRLPYLGAQGIPGPCPQLVSLGLCHVCPFLGIV